MAETPKFAWAWTVIPIVIFVGYRALTGSSLTRDVAKNVTSGSTKLSNVSKEQKERKMWLDYYDTGECQSNLKKKSKTDAAMVRMRREFGPDFDKIMTPSFDSYCYCVSRSTAKGDSYAQTVNSCKPIMETTIKKEAYGLGYDVYNN